MCKTMLDYELLVFYKYYVDLIIIYTKVGSVKLRNNVDLQYHNSVFVSKSKQSSRRTESGSL